MPSLTTLYKPLSPLQLAAVIQSGWRSFSPDTPQQRIFYPKIHRCYAEKIARQWDATQYSAGFVARFSIASDVINCYDIQTLGFDEHREYIVPIADLSQLNRHIQGAIEIVAAFTQADNHIWQQRVSKHCDSFH